MEEFNYLSVLVSIILGLGIAQLLTGLGQLINARARVRWYWPVVAWAGFLLIIHIQVWWAMFELRSQRQWSFLAFLVVLLLPILLYLASTLIFPDISGPAPIDLKQAYYQHAGWFFGLAASAVAMSLLRDWVIHGTLPAPLNTAIQVFFLFAAVGAGITRREWYHKLMLLFSFLLYGIYIAVLFAQLP